MFSADPSHGSRLTTGGLGHWFAQLCQAAGMPEVTLHRLRHTVATVLVGRGQILQAQYRLGHADAYTTLRIYSTPNPCTTWTPPTPSTSCTGPEHPVHELGRTPHARRLAVGCRSGRDRNHQSPVMALIATLPRLLFGPMLLCMQTLPISKVKDKLNELVDAAATTREQVTITKNGSPAAVLIGVDEWESIQESLFWLSQPGIRESIAEAEADVEEGRVYSEEQIRAEFNVPKGDR